MEIREEQMKIFRTTDYFHMTEEEAGAPAGKYGTKEEVKVLDAGLEHYFFETEKALREEFNSQKRKEYTQKYNYEVLIFEFVADNSNHNKYCMVFV